MKTISSILSMVILCVACGKESKNVTYLTQATPSSVSVKASENEMEVLRELLKSDSPNLALAELLAKSLSYEMKAEVKNLLADISTEEIEAIINEVKKSHHSVRENYLYHRQNYKNHQALIQTSLLNEENLKDHPFTLEKQLQITAFAYVKSKALNEIISIYDARSADLAQDLAKMLADDIAQNDPELAKKIEAAFGKMTKEKIVKMISDSAPFARNIDKYFKHSELSEKDQYLVMGSGILAGAVYTLVKDHQGFKNIKRATRDVQAFAKKAKEFSFLIKTLDTHIQDTKSNMENLGAGILGARKDLSSLYDEAKQGNKVESQKIMDFLYKNVITGQKTRADGSNSSILSKQVSINGNIDKSLTAAYNLSNNLSNILKTTAAMGELFGVKPSKDLMKFIDKAQKVSAVISLIQTGIMTYASGGVMGVMGALSSGPMMSLLGGGSQSSAQLSEISKKLDVVLENQRTMLKMQIETMNMIKDLALMVDMYHQKEMAALAELRTYHLVELEMQKTSLNKNIRSCERLINFERASVWTSHNRSQGSYHGIHSLRMVSAEFISSIEGLKGIRRIIRSSEAEAFESCQTGIAEVFGGNSSSENPIRSIFMTNDEENLYKFQKDIYQPLLENLYQFTKTTNLDSIPLHIPQKNMKGLETKKLFIDLAKSSDLTNDIYDMENLISVKGLERYLSLLIILHPILELDREIWNLDYRGIVNSYIEGSNPQSNQNVRSYYFLNNALKLTQSALAQEALLAGEPILPYLFEKHIFQMLSSEVCSEKVCELKKNKLLMKNLITYTLSRNVKNIPVYKTAYEKKDKDMLAKFFNANVTLEQMTNENEIVIEEIRFRLPTPEELEKGDILYSENMSRLLMMQDTIIENIEKVVPVKRDYARKDLLKLLMI